MLQKLKEHKKQFIIGGIVVLVVLGLLAFFLIRNNKMKTTNVEWISFEKAKQISLDDINTEEEVKDISVEVEKNGDNFYYKVKFNVKDNEYVYDINAVTGEIVKQTESDSKFVEEKNDNEENNENKEENNNDNKNDNNGNTANKNENNTSTKKYIGEAKAREIALNNAKVKDVTNYKIKLDKDNGIYVYEIEFDANGYEYEYDINATNGKILKDEKERDDDNDSKSSSSANTQKETYIGESNAKKIALNHAGVSNIKNYKIKLDKGDKTYEIEFDADGYEYEYEINAITGKIVKHDKERDDDYDKNNSSSSSTANYIGEAKAKEIALDHAGVKNITNYKIELDKEDNVYEIEFDADGYEYEYEINGTTGKIVKHDKEIKD